jgi:copper chaperone CopZ
MFRRSFIQRVTCGMAASGYAAAAHGNKTVTYRIEGFSCVTCAVGLDAMLREHKGIVRSKSTYPDATTVIEFNPHLVTETQIKTFIEETGFIARS